MSDQTLEFLTDAELQAASGGGFASAAATAFRRGASWAAKNPDKVFEGANAIHGAVTSKDQLQNLSSTFIV